MPKMSSSAPQTSLQSLLMLCVTTVPHALLFVHSVLSYPLAQTESSGAASLVAGSNDVTTDYNSIFNAEIEHENDLYATITAQNDIKDKQQAEASLIKPAGETVGKRQDGASDDSGSAVAAFGDIFNEELEHQQELYDTITAENVRKNGLQSEWSTTNSIPEGVEKRASIASRQDDYNSIYDDESRNQEPHAVIVTNNDDRNEQQSEGGTGNLPQGGDEKRAIASRQDEDTANSNPILVAEADEPYSIIIDNDDRSEQQSEGKKRISKRANRRVPIASRQSDDDSSIREEPQGEGDATSTIAAEEDETIEQSPNLVLVDTGDVSLAPRQIDFDGIFSDAMRSASDQFDTGSGISNDGDQSPHLDLANSVSDHVRRDDVEDDAEHEVGLAKSIGEKIGKRVNS